MGAGKTYSASMFHTGMSGANCCYFGPFTSLKELAIVRISLADYRDRCTSIQECLNRYRFWIFESDRIPFLHHLNNST